MTLQIEEDAFCEHCLELEPYTLCWDDGGCSWCMTCAQCGDFDFEHTAKEVKEWEKKAQEKQLEYYRGKVKQLESSNTTE